MPALAVIDVGAIHRWHQSTDPTADPWSTLFEAVRRSKRQFVWLVGPTLTPLSLSAGDRAQVTVELQSLAQRIVTALPGASVVRSKEPLVSILNVGAAPSDPSGIGAEVVPFDAGIITAGVEEHLHELAPLDAARVLLDLATGRLWRGDVVARAGEEPFILPALEAIVRAEGRGRPLGTSLAPRHRQALARALNDGNSAQTADVPTSLQKVIAERQVDLSVLGERLRHADPDPRARASLAAACKPPALLFPRGVVPGVVASVRRLETGRFQLDALAFEIAGQVQTVSETRAIPALRALHAQFPDLWRIGRSLDLLGWMVDEGVQLPGRVFDPGITAFVLEPDDPLSSARACSSARMLPGAVRDWLFDTARRQECPRAWSELIPVLGALCAELEGEVRHANLDQLVFDDIAVFVPTIARLERRSFRVGVPAGFTSWAGFDGRIDQELAMREEVFRRAVRGCDPYASKLEPVIGALKRSLGLLPAPRWRGGLKPADELDRYVHLGYPEAVALREARHLVEVREWVRKLEAVGTQVRPISSPQATGRWGMRSPALQSLVKAGLLGRELRSALLPPEGYRLMSADYAGHEARLLAGLSGDAHLLGFARTLDLHGAIGAHVFGADPNARGLAKTAMHPLIYGQTEDSFLNELPGTDHDVSRNLYRFFQDEFRGVLSYRDATIQQLRQAGEVRTRGGWRRVGASDNAAFSTLVQGLAADILRWVLPRLERRLQAIDAYPVHQVHDDIVVAVREGEELAAEQILVDVMVNEVAQQTDLIPQGIKLFVKKPAIGGNLGELV